ncbi:PAS domain-containing protein [Yoonia vestfoldensis]|uniref:PAS domain-containing protein n=1 Tax=Yoonia vestfoldensis TaxID=245188 RepID=UPI0005BDC6F4|nr:PAS domain-containing protein [Yoonia vestfoldensis]
MSIYHDSPDARRHGLPGADCPILHSLENYWHSLRHARHIPARNDVAPHMIDAALPHAFILQRVAPGVARMRVAGQKIHDLLRMDARGMPISVLFGPDSRDSLRDLVETAFTQPAIVAASLLSAGQMFRPALPATILMLPLRDEKGATSRVLGALVCEGMTGNRPRRFDLAPGRLVRIDSLAINLASSQPAPAQMQRPDAERPALRLVVDNG